jgi:hypothetical protein
MSDRDAYRSEINAQAARIVQALAREQYDLLRTARGSLADFIAAVESYRRDGFTIVDLPESAFETFEVYGPPKYGNEWDVEFPLWTRERGESDLHLYLVFRPIGTGITGFVDDIRVP